MGIALVQLVALETFTTLLAFEVKSARDEFPIESLPLYFLVA